MVEKTSRPDPDHVTLSGPIGRRAEPTRPRPGDEQGEVVVASGTLLNPARLGVLASVGAAEVVRAARGRSSRSRPRAMSWSHSTSRPAPGRSATRTPSCSRPWPSNSPRSRGRCRSPPTTRGPPRRPSPRASPRPTSSSSAAASRPGRTDLVPDALADVGVRAVFHKVRVKPGKPLWFGVGPDADDGRPGPSSSACRATP